MGVGALGLPWAAARLGWIASVTTLMVFAFCSTYSGVLLARCRVELYRGEGAGGYGDLAVRTVGPCFGAISRTIIVANWGLLLPYYLLTAGKSLIFIAPNAQICDWEWTAIMALAVVLPMQFTTLVEISSLCGASTIAIITAICIIIAKLFVDAANNEGGSGDATTQTTLWPPKETGFIDFFGALTAIVFAYQGQDIFCEVIAEMQDERDAPKAISTSYALMTLTYMFTVVTAYGLQGVGVEDFLPNSLEEGWRTSLVGGLVAFHILVAYLCLGIPFMNVIYRLLFPKTPIIMGGTGARARWFVLSIVVIGASFLVATAVPSFGAIQSLLGAFAGAPIVFGWPPLFYLLACHQKNIDVAGFDKVMCFLYLCVLLPSFLIFGAWDAITTVLEDRSEHPVLFNKCWTVEPTM
ncbi:hypothetical protein EMIHUDRAFT_109962 [Emiliania huxleyi CCMP1516]|uniref:Amino acid transporter transmembrane domain-containing protein n=2 Tax=Emiliania huxleyi TaxID=2903 RepID=A0A0D3KMZ9_EMIH1|nr:hypothetical protein EMIHUDRAFT_109962 [Emiliania huxleyi CCMP1516]EOD37134.1 hypothetical protein EMIHUDRAFT_109962 [Emiliania huxleyi CCMP1516]|eukprot:XP_005789563.1 hypothetical protein EMIHUDRAFT_109962 [Emiliania huxleyi CCMP1516]